MKSWEAPIPCEEDCGRPSTHPAKRQCCTHFVRAGGVPNERHPECVDAARDLAAVETKPTEPRFRKGRR